MSQKQKVLKRVRNHICQEYPYIRWMSPQEMQELYHEKRTDFLQQEKINYDSILKDVKSLNDPTKALSLALHYIEIYQKALSSSRARTEVYGLEALRERLHDEWDKELGYCIRCGRGPNPKPTLRIIKGNNNGCEPSLKIVNR